MYEIKEAHNWQPLPTTATHTNHQSHRVQLLIHLSVVFDIWYLHSSSASSATNMDALECVGMYVRKLVIFVVKEISPQKESHSRN